MKFDPLREAQNFEAELPTAVKQGISDLLEDIEAQAGDLFTQLPSPGQKSIDWGIAFQNVRKAFIRTGVQVLLRVPDGVDREIAIKSLEDAYVRCYKAFF